MSLTDEAWSLVKNTPRVTNFLGGGAKAKPIAIPEAEAMRVINQVQEGVEKPRPSITFDVGEEIRVKDGAFASFNGMVEEVDEEKARLKITVSIFGRAHPWNWITIRSKSSRFFCLALSKGECPRNGIFLWEGRHPAPHPLTFND